MPEVTRRDLMRSGLALSAVAAWRFRYRICGHGSFARAR